MKNNQNSSHNNSSDKMTEQQALNILKTVSENSNLYGSPLAEACGIALNKILILDKFKTEDNLEKQSSFIKDETIDAWNRRVEDE